MFQLLDRGYVKSIDDPISDYCPSFSIKNPVEIKNVVTLRLVFLSYGFTCVHMTIDISYSYV